MAGTIFGLGLSQRVDSNGVPEAGWKLYLYTANTTTPVTSYKDTGLTAGLEQPWPIVADSYGMMPAFWLADGTYRARGTSSDGGTLFFDQDGLLALGPSSGTGGGGASVDATTILATGDVKYRYGTGALTGFVRGNGRTIGSALSGATERANADCQNLFEYLWNTDVNLSVPGGRGVSASADWTANKQITLPDWRGRVLAGMDDMGNSAASRLTSSYFGANATVLNAVGGGQSQILTQAQLPNINLSAASLTAATSITNGDNVHRGVPGGYAAGAGGTSVIRVSDVALSTVTATTTIGGVVPLGGGGNAHPIVQPTAVVTMYIKL